MRRLVPRILIVLLTAFAALAIVKAGVGYRLAKARSREERGEEVKTAPQPPRFPVDIRPAPEPKRIATARRDHHGAAVTLDCNACHAVRGPDRRTNSSSQLDEFHQGLKFQHGTLSCAACHDDRDGYSSLHLADGTAITFADSMRLCAQCHGPQFRDYLRGSHGGMTGFWDLTRGGRTRNHCQHCHDPHSPAYPQVRPTAGPHDRFPPARHEASDE